MADVLLIVGYVLTIVILSLAAPGRISDAVDCWLAKYLPSDIPVVEDIR